MEATLPAPNYKAAFSAAMAAANAAAPERGLGCGRIYVVIVEKPAAREIAKAAKAHGKIFQAKAHYGLTNALYVGYDNNDGRALAQGTAIVATLKAQGIRCYREECGD